MMLFADVFMPTPEEIPATMPNGPAWAGILAAGIGCAVFGLLVDLAEAFKNISHTLNFYPSEGDLSGKSMVAIAVWAGVWASLDARWKNRCIQSPARIMVVTLILLALALIAVFPPFFGLFAAE